MNLSHLMFYFLVFRYKNNDENKDDKEKHEREKIKKLKVKLIKQFKSDLKKHNTKTKR